MKLAPVATALLLFGLALVPLLSRADDSYKVESTVPIHHAARVDGIAYGSAALGKSQIEPNLTQVCAFLLTRKSDPAPWLPKGTQVWAIQFVDIECGHPTSTMGDLLNMSRGTGVNSARLVQVHVTDRRSPQYGETGYIDRQSLSGLEDSRGFYYSPHPRPTATPIENVAEAGNNAAAVPTSATAISVRAPKVDLHLEVASTETQREQGLMGRTSIPAHTGMLFVFDEDGPKQFWTKNMRIPVDIIFIGADGAVSMMFANVAPASESVPDNDIPRESGVAKYVVVLAAGEAADDGITIGTKLSVQLPH